MENNTDEYVLYFQVDLKDNIAGYMNFKNMLNKACKKKPIYEINENKTLVNIYIPDPELGGTLKGRLKDLKKQFPKFLAT